MRTGAGRIRGGVLSWVALVSATVTIVMLLSVGASQACPPEKDPTSFVAQAATISQNATQMVTDSYGVAKFTIDHKSCCGRLFGHSHGLTCAGTCCPACSAGMITAGWAAGLDFVLDFDNPLPPIGLSMAELDTQFRPPRAVSANQAPA